MFSNPLESKKQGEKLMALKYPARVTTIADETTRTRIEDFMSGYAECLLRYHVQSEGVSQLLHAPDGKDWLDVYGDWLSRETVAVFTRDTLTFLAGNSVVCELYVNSTGITWSVMGFRFAGARNGNHGFNGGVSGQAAELNRAAVEMGAAVLDLRRGVQPRTATPDRLYLL